MPSSHTANEPRITLFVSYSRKDTLFVDALVKALEARGYDVRIDRSDIRKGEEWWKRIVDLIVDAMLVVFIISPDSVGSPVCRDEVDLTKRLGKRIVPLLWRSAPRSEIPEGLAERDWVSFKATDPSGTWRTLAWPSGPPLLPRCGSSRPRSGSTMYCGRRSTPNGSSARWTGTVLDGPRAA